MQTIAEYFQSFDPEEGIANIELIGYGMFPDNPKDKFFSWPHWQKLFDECLEAVKVMGEQPFRGGQSCAIIMDFGMKRFLKKHGGKIQAQHWHLPRIDLRVPPSWVYTIARLRELPEETS